jgi:hypothetical protein
LEDRCLLSFRPGVNYPAGRSPQAVTAADLRSNGITDLVVVNDNFDQNGTVSVLLGNGDGTFRAPVSYSVGVQPTSVAVAALHGDGTPDLVVTNRRSDTLSLLLGNGDGTFRDAVAIPTGGGPRSVAVGDFAGDGTADLAVTQSSGANAVNVFLGNGDGTFRAPVAYPTGFAPISVTAARLTGANLDLVVANELDKTVSVLLGNGDGTFQPAVGYDAGTATFSDQLVVGDFTGNGIVDLVVANDSGSLQVDGSLNLLLGNGDGTFQPAISQGISGFGASKPKGLAVGDFARTGNLGLVDVVQGGFLNVLLGNGDGTFRSADHILLSGVPSGVAVGDFNHDGFLDVAVSISFPRPGVEVFLNAADWGGAPGGSGTSSHRVVVSSATRAPSASSAALAQAVRPVAPDTSVAVARPEPVSQKPSAVAALFAASQREGLALTTARPAEVEVGTLAHARHQGRADAACWPTP